MNAFDYAAFFDNSLTALRREGRYRMFADLERHEKNPIRAFDHRIKREVTVWCSNDYLGMSVHPDVLAAAREALMHYGGGAGGTRNISGTNHEHVMLEAELADLHSKDAALLFTSGYVANDSALATLGRMLPDCVIFSDALNHASIIQGIRHSGADKQVFAHNDWRDLERKLRSVPRERSKLICFESCYSMDGDFAPLETFCDLAEEYGALTYLDEVHSVGLYGPRGGGVAALKTVMHRIGIIQGALSKGFGAIGGYIAAGASIVDFVRSFAPGFIFSTALPPHVVAGIRAAVRHLKHSTTEREQLHLRTASVKRALVAAGLPMLPSPSHILPIMIGDAVLAKTLTDELMQKHGVYIQAINYPTVPRGTERLRITPHPYHSDADEEALIAALVDVWRRHGIRMRRDKEPLRKE